MSGMKIDRCRSCGAPGVWMVTKNGKRILVDVESIEDEPTLSGKNLTFDHTLHRAHWATCPHAQRWRRRRRQS